MFSALIKDIYNNLEHANIPDGRDLRCYAGVK